MVRIAFWGCSAAVLYLALSPAPTVTVSDWDKVNHVFAFTVLGTLGFTAWPARRCLMASCLFAYGCAIEVLQSLFTLTRQGDWQDVVADVVGIVLAVAAIAVVTWAGRKRGG